MKNVLAWVKRRWAVVVCAVIVLVALPVGWVFSSGWNKSIRQDQEKLAKGYLDRLNSVKVSYSLPSISPDAPAIEHRAEPNAVLTRVFKEERERVAGEAKRIVEEAQRFNHQDRAPLIPNLFPKPATPEDDVTLRLEFVKALVGETGRPSAYQQLLARVGAGTPPDAAVVAADLADEKARADEAIKGANQSRQLTPEEAADIQKKLTDRRLGTYQRRASEISFYASMAELPKRIPQAAPPQLPSLEQCFQWQTDYWMVEQILSTIAKVNQSRTGSGQGVERSVVKRLLQLSFEPLVTVAPTQEEPPPGFPSDPSLGGGDPAAGVGPGNDGSAALLEPNFLNSITGRIGIASNGMFDTQEVNIVAVVSSERLPELINTFSTSNFVTLTDVRLFAVDPWAELETGHFYGSEHVVLAQLTFEVVWLRSWTAPLMPPRIKQQLGIPLPEGEVVPEGGDPSSSDPSGVGAPRPPRDR
ncbi:MAG: hypothetical protein SFZ23_13950 [Planctomycetota bacterium]|nr:hypothetical protein [Planctomycetota bacterium]